MSREGQIDMRQGTYDVDMLDITDLQSQQNSSTDIFPSEGMLLLASYIALTGSRKTSDVVGIAHLSIKRLAWMLKVSLPQHQETDKLERVS